MVKKTSNDKTKGSSDDRQSREEATSQDENHI